MPFITALEPEPAGSGIRVAVDGAPFGTVSAADVRELRLAVGEALDDGRLSALSGRADVFSARTVALRVLAARALPSREVARRLTRKGHRREAAEAAVGALVESGLIDDWAFARHYAGTRARRGKLGPGRLVRDLRRLGLAERDAEAAVREALADEGLDPRVLLREAAAKKARTLQGLDPATGRRRLKAYLMRRGFSAGDVSEVVKEALAG
jgi:SOS response regulatory protein OraA/RecX